MNIVNSYRMRKFFLIIVLLLNFGGCEDWVQDRRYPWQTAGSEDAGTPTQDFRDADAAESSMAENHPDCAEVSASDASSDIADSSYDAKPDVSVADSAASGNHVAFDLPSGWNSVEDRTDTAILHSQSMDGVKPEVLLQAYVSRFNGTREDARQFALNDHDERHWNCVSNECFNSNYHELSSGGTDIFVSDSVNTYWGSDSSACIIWFEKNGTVFRIDLDDSYFGHETDILKVIETIRLE